MGLQILWFILWGLLWAVYFMLDGFDFGSVLLRPFVSKNDAERTAVLRAIGPIWDGNEVWLITAGGATFAAFPATYADMFSFLYLPMLIVLFSLIGRGISIEFRGRNDAPAWRGLWDAVMWVCSFVAPFFFGLIFGNIFRGLPMTLGGYAGSFGGLFNPYGILTGVLFVGLFVYHGALYLSVKTEGGPGERARAAAGWLWYVVVAVAAIFLVATGVATRLYDNFVAFPEWFAVPLIALLALLATKLCARRNAGLAAFFASCLLVVTVVFTGIIGLYPNLIPSSLDPEASLTAFNSSSSHLTLTVMTLVAAIFVPIVVAYQIVVYRVFRERVPAVHEEGESEAY